MLTTLAALFALLFGFTGSAIPTIEATPTSATVQHIEEDEAGWDCATMGNKVCGPAPAADAAEVLWPAVDNQYAAMVQCNYFLDAGADLDACINSAQDAFPAIPACVEEDSNGPCYWDATTRSNGVGDSFTANGNNVVTYLDAAIR